MQQRDYHQIFVKQNAKRKDETQFHEKKMDVLKKLPVKKPRLVVSEATNNETNAPRKIEIATQTLNLDDTNNRVRYRRSYFMQITFGLFALTLLPIQFQNDKLHLQVLKVADDCTLLQNSTREVFLAETGRLLSDSTDQVLNPNVTIKYLSREECEQYKNSSNLFDVFTLKNGSAAQEENGAPLNYTSIYLCIDDVSKNFILNETFLRDMLLNSYFNVKENLAFKPALSVLSKVNIFEV
jgi:hypothetical protein